MLSIFFIASVNIWSIYIFYNSYIKIYLEEKIQSRDVITLEYINEVIRRQTVDEIDSIFSDTEVLFYELLEEWNWEIKLDNQKNIDIVINYLNDIQIGREYIENFIPTDNLKQILIDLKDKTSPEYRFINRLTVSIIITNILAIGIILVLTLVVTRRTLQPIKEATSDIKNSNPWKNYKKITYYNKKDEIGLLITAINELHKKLNLQESIRTRLLADISHELKTPITSIQCYLEWISDWVIKLNQKNLNAITDEMRRLILMVNKIMEYEKFERKELEINKTNEVLAELIIKVVETNKKRLKENKQRIKVTWDTNVIEPVDKDLFIQLVHNVIWNFLKYSWKKTLLRINITKTYIDFSDDWVGIKSSELPYLTEKFYQGNIEKTGDVDMRWIWVWLSITRRIIESHGWKFEIKSDTWKWFSFKVYTKKS